LERGCRAASELWKTGALGLLLLGGGNGALVFAEVWIPSGLAALFITTSPFWMVGLDAALPGGERLHLPTLVGIVVGLAGVLILFAPGTEGASMDSATLLKGFLVLQFGCFCWCLGTALHRRLTTTGHPAVSGAVQQFATGLAFMPAAIFVNEQPIKWSERGIMALCWLVDFRFDCRLQRFRLRDGASLCSHSLDVLLRQSCGCGGVGLALLPEPFGWRETLAMLAVFTGVALVKYYSSREPRPTPEAAKA
jgi:drug/metabolite transporter (DMT)-like permease